MVNRRGVRRCAQHHRNIRREDGVASAAPPRIGLNVGFGVRAAREKGMAIVLISADLEELIGMSDRLLVMLRGAITAELDPAKTTPEQLGSAMTGAA